MGSRGHVRQGLHLLGQRTLRGSQKSQCDSTAYFSQTGNMFHGMTCALSHSGHTFSVCQLHILKLIVFSAGCVYCAALSLLPVMRETPMGGKGRRSSPLAVLLDASDFQNFVSQA